VVKTNEEEKKRKNISEGKGGYTQEKKRESLPLYIQVVKKRASQTRNPPCREEKKKKSQRGKQIS